MRVRNKPWAKDKLLEHSALVIPDPENYKGKWREKFNHSAPLHVEIGTGKGQFILGMAEQYPDINFIGIELEESIIVSALEKLLDKPLPNVLFLNKNANDLTDFFAENEVDELYLNFSDPWPKNRHEKRRLTYKSFLQNYRQVLKTKGKLNLKTDNRGFFEYSLESFSQFGLTLGNISLDLHASECPGNIMTEYEEKFSAKGQPIYRCEASF
ncbi:tRNA (guanine-N7-)-methyltransferase [Pullulanibacillus pueri]|uniref:tRNA (guanine-N(7)-)-methyltransferase n=1 Tax=Pullulanibacillus pueri TaxID=1437324 RepID=A0A8J3EPM5_9BACL|nr:tRNA (guanosine(46)-N7)-methyltransferase TrmB [Pullulanibacillus pueri]MBM7684268.1 tRNA (guanine-N7-)-methyltransferase [Pullulanibacillus pueri]GGH89158.1 tRNA (guanine-N(7)-)-methyltransferase [Pullulanibacillus pueri]